MPIIGIAPIPPDNITLDLNASSQMEIKKGVTWIKIGDFYSDLTPPSNITANVPLYEYYHLILMATTIESNKDIYLTLNDDNGNVYDAVYFSMFGSPPAFSVGNFISNINFPLTQSTTASIIQNVFYVDLHANCRFGETNAIKIDSNGGDSVGLRQNNGYMHGYKDVTKITISSNDQLAGDSILTIYGGNPY